MREKKLFEILKGELFPPYTNEEIEELKLIREIPDEEEKFIARWLFEFKYQDRAGVRTYPHWGFLISDDERPEALKRNKT